MAGSSSPAMNKPRCPNPASPPTPSAVAAPLLRYEDPEGRRNEVWHAANRAREIGMAATAEAMSRLSLFPLPAPRSPALRFRGSPIGVASICACGHGRPCRPVASPPLGYVIRVDPERRERVLQALHADRIFAAVHWTEIIAPTADFPREQSWTHELITLPCDHRYNAAEMDMVGARVENFWEMTHPYATLRYAKSLPHIGEPFAVPEWGTHVLIRAAQGGRRDAVGPYPVACIAADADLEAGLARLRAADLVSVVLVLEDILRPRLGALEDAFDIVRLFKTHLIHDRTVAGTGYGKHHRYEIKRARSRSKALEISLGDHLEGLDKPLPRVGFAPSTVGSSRIPRGAPRSAGAAPGSQGVRRFRRRASGPAHLFVAYDGYAISHLAASTQEGYEIGPPMQ